MKPPAKEASEIEPCKWPDGHAWSIPDTRCEQECFWCRQRRVLRDPDPEGDQQEPCETK